MASATRTQRIADRIVSAAVQRLERLVTSESLRMASELAKVGISGAQVAVLIATALRATADGLEGKENAPGA